MADAPVTFADTWHTLAPMADSVVRDPRATIKPDRSAHETGREVVAALARRLHDDPSIRLERTIGEGGMGRVHLASQVALGRDVAVKTLKPDHRNERATLSMLQEAWVTGALEHPNVVPVYDLGLEPDGTPYLVLRCIEGSHWGELMHDADAVRERFGADDPLAWNLQILMQVCNAVHFAHSRGILHRDLKPENVMIGAFGEVYVLDWGIAVSLRDDGTGRMPLATRERKMAGTPSYMAPEMLVGGDRLTEATDVYLLGAVLYEILTGRPPHRGEDFEAIVRSIVDSSPTLPRDAPQDLADLCRAALSPDPAARPGSAEAVRLSLQAFLSHRSSAALADEASRQLDDLLIRLDGARADDRLALYDRFGACRFGFREALRTWPDNAAARDGLLRATTAMVHFELGQGAPQAAAMLLSELPDAPADLAERVAEAARRAARRNRRIARIARDHDHRVGQRTRNFVTAVLGLVWTLSPLVVWYLGGIRDHATSMAASGVMFALVAVVALWARESLTATAVNRRSLAAITLVPVFQILLDAGAWMAGIDVATSRLLHVFLWSVMSALVAMSLDLRIWPAPFGYAAAWLVGARFPDAVDLVMSAGHLGLIVTVGIVWLRDPASISPSDPASPAGRRDPASDRVAPGERPDMRS